MPRKKMTRSAKGNKMQANTKNTLEKMEKDFRDAPTKIAEQYKKEVVLLTKQEAKLTVELNKAQNLQKALQKKQAVLVSQKATASTKKQLKAHQKAQKELTQAIKEATAQLAKIKTACEKMASKQTAFTALGKQLVKLEKQLTPKKAAPVKNKVKKVQRKASSLSEVTHTSEAPVAVQEIETADAF